MGTTFFGKHGLDVRSSQTWVLSGELHFQAAPQTFSVGLWGGRCLRLCGPKMCVSLNSPLDIVGAGSLRWGRGAQRAQTFTCLCITCRACLKCRLGVGVSRFEVEFRNLGFPGGLEDKESACNARDRGSIPGSGRSPGEEDGNPLQNSCLENSKDRGAWRATVLGVAESDMTE